MTLLAYMNDNNDILVGMDTLVTHKNIQDSSNSYTFAEKTFFIKSANTLVCGTGSLAILATIVNYIKDESLTSCEEVYNLIEEHIEHITNHVVNQLPWAKEEKFTFYIFGYNDNNVAHCFRFIKNKNISTYQVDRMSLKNEDLYIKPNSEDVDLTVAKEKYPETIDLCTSVRRENANEKLMVEHAILSQISDLEKGNEVGIGGELYLYRVSLKKPYLSEEVIEFVENSPKEDKMNWAEVYEECFKDVYFLKKIFPYVGLPVLIKNATKNYSI